jgi:hypothetical protein
MVFNVPLSETQQKLEALKKQRMLYRLTLGQPDQEDLVKALHGRVDEDEAISATLVLAPWRYGEHDLFGGIEGGSCEE